MSDPMSDPVEPASPRGALVVAGLAVAVLFLGWLAFYFLLFLPRGSIG
jgi:hypothetical protein